MVSCLNREVIIHLKHFNFIAMGEDRECGLLHTHTNQVELHLDLLKKGKSRDSLIFKNPEYIQSHYKIDSTY